DIDAEDRGAEQPLAARAPFHIRRAHGGVTALRKKERAVRAEIHLIVQMIAPAAREIDDDVAIFTQLRSAQHGDFSRPVAGAFRCELMTLVEHELTVAHPQDEMLRTGRGVEANPRNKP